MLPAAAWQAERNEAMHATRALGLALLWCLATLVALAATLVWRVVLHEGSPARHDPFRVRAGWLGHLAPAGLSLSTQRAAFDIGGGRVRRPALEAQDLGRSAAGQELARLDGARTGRS